MTDEIPEINHDKIIQQIQKQWDEDTEIRKKLSVADYVMVSANKFISEGGSQQSQLEKIQLFAQSQGFENIQEVMQFRFDHRQS